MRSVYFPSNSFQDTGEYKKINELFLEYSHTLYEEIDDNVEISIFGNRDLSIIKSLTGFNDRHENIIDPSDQLPIQGHNDLSYIALVYYKNPDNPDGSGQIIYGSVDYKLHDFISLLLYRLACKFPKSSNSDILGDHFMKEYEREENFN